MENRALTEAEADALAKWRWGERGFALTDSFGKLWVGEQINEHAWTVIESGPTWAAAFRAAMSSPMTDLDAGLEARLRLGGSAIAYSGSEHKQLRNARGYLLGEWGLNEPWEKIFEDVERMAYARDVAPRALPDLTRDEALTEAHRLWGDRAYAFAAVGKAPLAVGCPGVANGTGKTFREAFSDAERRRVWLALATAFGAVGCAVVREQNKRVGQRLIDSRPDWAYPLGWRLAVMAAVEAANREPIAVAAEDSAIPVILQSYHRSRLAGRTIELSLAMINGRDRVRDIYRLICAAYERGRGAPGGGR